jgi:adenylate cyclase
MAELGKELERSGRAAIRVGVGLNTGEVLLGNIGSVDRMDFTAIGDVVNVADRLQSQALGGEVLMGPETARLLAAALPTEDLGERSVKGKDRPIRVLRLRLV